ncbi:hypothetical protein BJ742DRAFT_872795 [Cladochytrium replicatum]|nr:hypothetical protein BJ742DRAFT_872795 [Cladochytrium replicatum]
MPCIHVRDHVQKAPVKAKLFTGIFRRSDGSGEHKWSHRVLEEQWMRAELETPTAIQKKLEQLVTVLDWRKSSGLKMKWSERSTDRGTFQILKYVYLARKYDHLKVLRWWSASGLEISPSMSSRRNRWSTKGDVDVLRRWNNSGPALKWSAIAMDLVHTPVAATDAAAYGKEIGGNSCNFCGRESGSLMSLTGGNRAASS